MRTPLLALTAVLVAAAPAAGQPTTRDHRTSPPAYAPPPTQVAPPPRAYQFDSRGLILLGEKPLTRRGGREVLRVPPNIGRRFDRLTLVVSGGDVDLGRAVVRYADRSRFDYAGRHQFRVGGETVAIDLPNDQRELDAIEVGYRTQRPQRGTTLQVWGRPRPAPPRPTPARWDNRGWVQIGEQWIEGRHDRIRLETRRDTDNFTRLMLVVEESDLELRDLKVTFSNRSTFSPKLKRMFREGDRTHAIDLPANVRTVRTIDVRASNLPGGGRAKVAIWGLLAAPPPVAAPPPPPPPYSGPKFTWNNTGWDRLGEQWVDGRRDVIELRPTGGKPNYNKLTIVVTESDLELHDVVVTFGNGSTFRPELKHYFRENDRARAIDLPGGTRTIRSVTFKASNLPGGGKAKIELFGK